MKVEHNKKVLKILVKQSHRSMDLYIFLIRKKLNGHPKNFSDYNECIDRMVKWLKAIDYIIVNGWSGKNEKEKI